MTEYWFKDLECQIWWTNTKLFFWESGTKLETLQNLGLKSVKTRNRIFWAMEYWFKAWECQIWSTNTKPFFRESERNLGALQKVFLYIGASYKSVLKSLKCLNRIFWVIEYWLKNLECQIWPTNTKTFFWESDTILGTLQKLSPYIGVAYKFVFKCVGNLSWMWFSFFQMLWMLNVQLSNIQLEKM